MASQPNPGLLGLDRSDTAFHPNTFLRAPSTNVSSAASVCSSGKKKVHFDDESIAESSGTQPTSVGSTFGPESTTYKPSSGNNVDAVFDHRPPACQEQLYDTLTGLGDHLPDIQHSGDFEVDVGPDPASPRSTRSSATTIPIIPTTPLPPNTDLNTPYHRRTRKAWVRAHDPNAKRTRYTEKPIVHNPSTKRRSSNSQSDVNISSRPQAESIHPSDIPPSTPQNVQADGTTLPTSHQPFVIALLVFALFAPLIWTAALLTITLLQILRLRNMIILGSISLIALLAGLLYIATAKPPSNIVQLVVQVTGRNAWDLVAQLEREFRE